VKKSADQQDSKMKTISTIAQFFSVALAMLTVPTTRPSHIYALDFFCRASEKAAFSNSLEGIDDAP
jgi:hypothetical protein